MKQVLLIGFFDSPHFARWVEILLKQPDLSFTLFCSSPARKVNPILKSLLQENPERLYVSPFSPKRPWMSFVFDQVPLVNRRRRALGKTLMASNFDVVHFFEMQHSGYLLNELKVKPPTKYVYSSYGSDIYWFGKISKHKAKIESSLANVDLIFYECERDMEMMEAAVKKDCNFVKTVNSGGLESSSRVRTYSRNQILVKGYSNRWGMALWTLWQLRKIRRLLRDNYQIVLYTCDYHVPPLAKIWGVLFGLKVTSFRKGSLSHEQTLALFERSLIHIAISRSDGIPSSTLEAMRGGALPIQSNTACMGDWITNGVNGFLIEIDSQKLVQSVKKIISDEDFFKTAQIANEKLIRTRHGREAIGRQVTDAYSELLKIK